MQFAVINSSWYKFANGQQVAHMLHASNKKKLMRNNNMLLIYLLIHVYYVVLNGGGTCLQQLHNNYCNLLDEDGNDEKWHKQQISKINSWILIASDWVENKEIFLNIEYLRRALIHAINYHRRPLSLPYLPIILMKFLCLPTSDDKV